MAVTEHTTTDQSGSGVAISRVDCDVHPTYKRRWEEELAPYLSQGWRTKFGADVGYKGSDSGARFGLGVVMPFNGFYPIPRNPVRNDLCAPDLPPPCSDPEITGRDLFDGYGIDRAVLVPAMYHQQLPEPRMVNVLSTAANSHLEEHWLNADLRWRGLMSAPWVTPQTAVEEIDRRASSNNQWVGVMLSPGMFVMGHDHYWPIYEACEHHGLVIQTHVSGAAGMYHTGGGFAGGMPLHHMDYRVAFNHHDQNHLASMISAGVFERFPNLKFVMTESGFAWLPQMLWQMDSFWKGNREGTPWLQRRPSEYIFDQVRFTTQPFIEPEKRDHVDAILEMIHAEQTLMFATDYPHWDADTPDDVFRRIPEKYHERVSYQTALETYGERLV